VSRAGSDSLSEEEIIFSCVMTFVAGHETTKCLIGNGMRKVTLTRIRTSTVLISGWIVRLDFNGLRVVGNRTLDIAS